MSHLLYGIHPVHEALLAGRRKFKAVYVSKSRKGKGIGPLVSQARAEGIPVESRPPDYFRSCLSDSVHQGVAAEVGKIPLSDERAMLKNAEARGELPLLLALDGVEDPQNLGSLVRSALAMGVHGLILPKVRSAPLSPVVSKASSGAMEHMLFARVPNLVAMLEGLKKAGLWIMGAHGAAGEPVDQIDFGIGLALVIGGEDKGLRPLVRKTCDYLVSIPQRTVVDSLNASIAGAIIMYEITRQRAGSGRM